VGEDRSSRNLHAQRSRIASLTASLTVTYMYKRCRIASLTASLIAT